MNIFMQHWYWKKYPTLFNFELKLKVVKVIKHFFFKNMRSTYSMNKLFQNYTVHV